MLTPCLFPPLPFWGLLSPGLWERFLEPLFPNSEAQSSRGQLAWRGGELLACCSSAKARVSGWGASQGGPFNPNHTLYLQPVIQLSFRVPEPREKREEPPSILCTFTFIQEAMIREEGGTRLGVERPALTAQLSYVVAL